MDINKEDLTEQIKCILQRFGNEKVYKKRKEKCVEIEREVKKIDENKISLDNINNKYMFNEEWLIIKNLSLLKKKLGSCEGIFEFYQFLLIETYAKKIENKGKTWGTLVNFAELIGAATLAILTLVWTTLVGEIALALITSGADVVSSKSKAVVSIENLLNKFVNSNIFGFFLISFFMIVVLFSSFAIFAKMRERRKYKETWARHTTHFSLLYGAMITFLNDGICANDSGNAIGFLQQIQSIVEKNINKFKENVDNSDKKEKKKK